MKTSVNFQGPFSYNIGLIIGLVIVLFLFVIGAIIVSYEKQKRKEIVKEIVKPKNLEEIKKEYLNKITELEDELKNNKVTTRKSYQKLSLLIRMFVYEVTKINVQKLTLKEIKKYKLPILTELVEEYYVPEFAKEEPNSIEKSLEKTRKAIEKWN